MKKKLNKLKRVFLPSILDISPTNRLDLDENSAVGNFHGKNIDEAYEMISKNIMAYIDDFVFMGPLAFEYYSKALLCYFQEKKHCYEGFPYYVQIILSILKTQVKEKESRINSNVIDLIKWSVDNLADYMKWRIEHKNDEAYYEYYYHSSQELETLLINLKKLSP